MKTKAFDCVQMKRSAQQWIRAAVEGLDRQQEIEFCRIGAEDFERRIKAGKQALSRSHPTAGT